jgi:hypothetical protein
MIIEKPSAEIERCVLAPPIPLETLLTPFLIKQKVFPVQQWTGWYWFV